VIVLFGSAQAEMGGLPVRAPILVIDDDPDIVDMLREALEGAGHRVITARDGLEGLERLRTVEPSLILLDMRMPRMDGWEFARAARERGNTAPVVVITAAGDASAWAKEIAAEAYMAKPFTISQLLGVVDRLGPRRPS
jgi:two-component system response regulator MprA